MATHAEEPDEVHALLTDGTTASIRTVRPDDRERVLEMYRRMSPDNLRRRFFAASRRSAEQAAERICTLGSPTDQALLALVGDKVIGVAEYHRVDSPDRPQLAEIGLTVADDWHEHGVGTLLLEHLAHAARAAGVTAFTAESLADNHLMLKVVADLGLRTTRRFEQGEVYSTIELQEDEQYLTAVDARGCTADVASLRPLLRPRSVAVIGAGRKETSVGRAVLTNLRRQGFNGALYAVNPHAASIADVPSCPTVALLPEVPELAVLAVPAHALPDVAEQCGARGVRALVVVGAGLRAAEATGLLTACRRHGMRLVGPNCLGLANTDPAARLNATFAATAPRPGTAGVAVQSGGVGIALLGALSRLGIGVSSFVSLGDKYDVSGNDLLQWWECDGRTDLAVLHLESFGNPRAFSRTARRLARRMPVLTVDAGRSEAGRRAAASHTAALATPTMTRRALFRQAGIIPTHGLGELVESAALLHSQPLPSGPRVAIVSNAGGPAVLAADACADAGLTVPELPAPLAAELASVLPAGAGVANPVDTTPAVASDAFVQCVERLARHGAVDAVLAVLVPTAIGTTTGEAVVRALAEPNRPRPRPVTAVLLDQAVPVRLLPETGDRSIPTYAESSDAARALAHAVQYSRWRAEPLGSVPALDRVDTPTATLLVADFLQHAPEGGWADPRLCGALLDAYGIPQQPWAWADSPDAAATAAERLGLPAALKAHWPGIVHKSEVGAVRLDLNSPNAVRIAYRSFAQQFDELMTGAVVQPMAGRGVELVAGVTHDDVFGPLVLFGLGGTATEVLADHAARLAPLTDQDVHALITAPRCAPLLFGQNSGGPVDLEGLEQLLHRLSRMACDLPQLAEADLNPVLARAGAPVTALDVRIRLVPRTAHDPYLRRLRAR
ncbi:GNAT family N-acetyltransferase [Streptomyces sp. CA-132043]|uniref:bifunctional acetate--CoA ligase family protein/GNAT family N-acetyltransferase n=1 Tax=Streptomyces sp. CA-132043 TaxID=3240048 RepID=UPI003D8D6BD9